MNINVPITIPDDLLIKVITTYIEKQFEIKVDYYNRLDLSKSGIIVQLIEQQVTALMKTLNFETEIKAKLAELYPNLLDDVIHKSLRARMVKRFNELKKAGELEGL